MISFVRNNQRAHYMLFAKRLSPYDGHNPNNCRECGIAAAVFVFWPLKLNMLQQEDLQLVFKPFNVYKLCAECDQYDDIHMKYNMS